ncbi:MAG: hypothetical protein WAK60_03580 [Sedimentisphaerales bacterium]
MGQSGIVRFHCKNCGQKFSVPWTIAGKKGRCPKCKNIVIVPAVEDAKSVTNQLETDASEIDSKASVLDDLQKLQAGKFEPEPPPERKLPWIIDVLMYPTSKTCLIMLGVFIGIKLLMKVFWLVLDSSESPFSPLYFFSVCFLVISLYVNIVIMLYVFWYFCECIRDSAYGGIRAPETVAKFDELKQSRCLVINWIIFWLPPILYSLIKYPPWRVWCALFTLSEGESPIGLLFDVIKDDIVFSLLWLYAIYFFPMALLSVILFDSLSGLNPLIIIPAILRTFFKYFLVVVVFYIPLIALLAMRELYLYLPEVIFRFGLLGLLLRLAWVWLLLIVGHLTGRYYYRNEKKLYWGV